MSVSVRPEAQKQLAGLPKVDRDRLVERLEGIGADPYGNHPDAKRLKGTPGFRVRHGDWRAIYRIDGAGDVIVIEVKHRREAY
jgi:mRNA interferase RelE/StbE